MTTIDPKFIDEMARRLADAMPKGLSVLQQDLEKNLRAGLASVLRKMELVSREEFEVQQAVLQRTRAKLEALDKQLQELEQRFK